MNIQELRSRQGQAKARAGKDAKERLAHLLSQVDERERVRLAAVGAKEKAESDLHAAVGEVAIAESNLNRAIAALEAEIKAV